MQVSRSIGSAVWSLAVRVRDLAKRHGFGGPLENVAWRIALRLIPPPQHEITVTIPTGAALRIPAKARSARTFMAGRYEEATTRWVLQNLRPRMTFVDVGANIGYYTLLASRLVGDEGRVFAFEPLPRQFEALTRNLEANSCANVVALNRAVGRESGQAFLTDEGESSYLGNAGVSVEVVSLDDFFAARGWPPIGLLKLDIEGGELAVLGGMTELSARNTQLAVVTEYSPEAMKRMGVSWSEMAEQLVFLGFRRCVILDQGLREIALARHFESRSLHNLLLTK